MGPPGVDGEDGLDSLVPGPQGIPGAPGAPGLSGIQGIDGEDGLDSLVPGPQGTPGTNGTNGTIGATGPPGFSGVDGDDGMDSLVPGPQGIQGPQGNIGNTGPQGPIGLGLDGIDGDDGQPGIAGIRGADGATGAAGLRGPPGMDGEGGGGDDSIFVAPRQFSGVPGQIAFFNTPYNITTESGVTTGVLTNALTWDATKNAFGIGTSTPAFTFHVIDTGGFAGLADYVFDNYYTINGAVPELTVRASDGTPSAPVAIGNGMLIGIMGFRSFGATVFPTTANAGMRATTTQTYTDAVQGTKLELFVTSQGTTIRQPILTANSDLSFTGFGGLFRVDVLGNIETIRGITGYAWPTVQQSGSLTNDGAGGLTWAAGGTGARGAPGIDGDDGLDSLVPGPQGLTGQTGATGLRGFPGQDGDDGLDGLQGPQGPVGQNGQNGATGPVGPIGLGIDGVDGEDGQPGIAGIRGLDGATGSSGPAGRPGMDADDGGGGDSLGFLSGPGVSGIGTATQVAFWNGATNITGDNALFWDNTNKRLGVGTTAPLKDIEIIGVSAGAITPTLRVSAFTPDNTVSKPLVEYFRSKSSSIAVASACTNGTILGSFNWVGDDGTGPPFNTASSVFFTAVTTEAFTSIAHGSGFLIGTTLNGTVTQLTRLNIDHDGTLKLNLTKFIVSPTGDLTTLNNVSGYTWPTVQGAGVLTNNGSGGLTWSRPQQDIPSGLGGDSSDDADQFALMGPPPPTPTLATQATITITTAADLFYANIVDGAVNAKSTINAWTVNELDDIYFDAHANAGNFDLEMRAIRPEFDGFLKGLIKIAYQVM